MFIYLKKFHNIQSQMTATYPNPPSHNPKNNKDSHNFAKRSSVYQEFLAERNEILRHKWIESEKVGRDIGFERALLDWIRKHRENWRKARKD